MATSEAFDMATARTDHSFSVGVIQVCVKLLERGSRNPQLTPKLNDWKSPPPARLAPLSGEGVS